MAISNEMFGKLKTILEEGNGGFLRYGVVDIYNADKSFHIAVEGEYEEIDVFINQKKMKSFHFEEGEYPDAELMEILKFIQESIKPFVESKFTVKGVCDGNISNTKEWSKVVLKETFVKFMVDFCGVPQKNIRAFVTQ